ncbi:YgiW/YdeI family stress tolerance OB fold protein [Pseudorhodoferax sp.]|uniref:YgiW/YdeI family stress tolerance OB fold protein n=1 Tax=Pseudorhodoferax sp. TaxID=1993553 RepID=UPI0039E5C237
MHTALPAFALAALLATGTAAFAQAQPPSGYTGPSSVPLTTVQQLLAAGRDDQPARLQGRLVSHDGGDRYTFADDTGRITAEIDAKDFPPGQAIGAEQRVELHGEFEKGRRTTKFEVDRIVVLP